MIGRYAEKNNIQNDKGDFVERSCGSSIWKILSAHMIIAIAICILLDATSGKSYALYVAIGFAILFLSSFSIYMLLKERQITTATEFLNAMFASSIQSKTSFALIVKNDGSICYANQEYNNLFSHFRRKGIRGINALLECNGLDDKSRDIIVQALASNKGATVPFNIEITKRDASQIEMDQYTEEIKAQQSGNEVISLYVTPLRRPKNYFYIWASLEANEELQEDQEPQIALTSLDNVEVPIYISSEFGVIEYANQAMMEFINISNIPHKARIDSYIDFTKNKVISHSNNNADFTINKEPIENNSTLNYIHVLHETKVPINYDDNRIIDYLPIATAVINKEGNIKFCNKEFNGLTGSRANSNIYSIIENSDSLKDFLNGQTTSNSTKKLDVNIIGRNIHNALLYITKPNEQNDNQYVINLVDTTEQKSLELKFVHSQKMQAVGQLAGGIAHDFNNLLTAIIGFCDLLLLRHPSGDASFYEIMQIKQNSARAANLVRQLLAFSRKQTLQPQVTNITDVLAELSNLIGRLIGENIELKMDHGNDINLVKVDPGQLEQVIINLAVNARDAMSGGGTLKIRTSNVNIGENDKHIDEFARTGHNEDIIRAGSYVCIEVIDSGSGIPPEIMNKIFDPFFTTKEIGSGTGLGLSTVYGIIKQTEGYIYVSSQAGRGTRFSIYFKQHKETASKKNKSENLPVTDKLRNSDLTGRGKILLVEDEDPVRAFAIRALTNKGYDVSEADCGEVGLEFMQQHGNDIDLIITDVVMPGITGPAMITEVMKDYPEIPVIFISGYGEDAFVSTYGSERNFNFLAKPFTLKQLAKKVKEVIEENSKS